MSFWTWLLRLLGFLPNEGETYIVAGQVLKGERAAFAGRVALFGRVENETVRIGETVSDSEGRYSLRYRVPRALRSAQVAVFDGDGQRIAESDSFTPSGLDIIHIKIGLSAGMFTVSGQVKSATRPGMSDLRVVIVDREIPADRPLGEARTDSHGFYRASFSYGGKKARPDLQARAYHGDALLGASDVHYNAKNLETLDIPLAETADAHLTSEYESLTKDIAAVYDGRLRDLQETEERQDVSLIANKIGWDARAVAMAALADQFANRVRGEIPADLFYALFRAGLAAEAGALYGTDLRTIEATWRLAIAQGIISKTREPQLAEYLKRFGELSVKDVVNRPAVAGLSTLADLLRVSLADPSEKDMEEFARLHAANQDDPAKFWTAVKGRFGEEPARRLELDGKLGYLTLNNAALVKKLHLETRENRIGDPADLVQLGFSEPRRWLDLIDAVPPEIPGEGEAARLQYAEVLAAQLQLTYPNAVLANLIEKPANRSEAAVKSARFLREHQDKFVVGLEPVERFAARSQVMLEPEVRTELTRVERLRQITPSDSAMSALMQHGIGSAYEITRYDRDEFVRAFAGELTEADAVLVHERARQIHNVVLNIASSYLIAKTAPGIGVHSPAQIIDPPPEVPAVRADVIAYDTLESLFGAMDYCECDHCRSVLSPAAYLVSLLQLLDRTKAQWTKFTADWKADHGGAPYPFADMAAWTEAGAPLDSERTPLEVLLARRPDLQHLPLTCENTNTPIPYIDVVNEVLEFYVTHNLDLSGYTGHTTDGSVPAADLLSSPQFVNAQAYKTLAEEYFPLNLPYHKPLESLRRSFAAFDCRLPQVMAALSQGSALEATSTTAYGWRDIWIETLGLSRAEFKLLCDSGGITLAELYGYPKTYPPGNLIAELSNARAFARRLDISYEDVVALLTTSFMNPDARLVPRLERLGVSIATIKSFKDGTLAEADFVAALAPLLDPAAYGGDIKAWVRDPLVYPRIMSLLVLADPSGSPDVGRFERLYFRYADPAKLAVAIRENEFLRLVRFTRLWKKLGWSMDQVDAALNALGPIDRPADGVSESDAANALDAAFKEILPRLGAAKRAAEMLKLDIGRDLTSLLSCFASIGTAGPAALYRKLFIESGLAREDSAFADDGYGRFLERGDKLAKHAGTLRAACNLTEDEFAAIVGILNYDATTPLDIQAVSAIYRRAWLARRLRLSIVEFLGLAALDGLDPFAPFDPTDPPLLRFIAFAERLRAASLRPVQALSLVWNTDVAGKAPADDTPVTALARTLRSGIDAINRDLEVVEDPDGQIARARMALAYDAPTTDLFFGLLDRQAASEVSYDHTSESLPIELIGRSRGRLAYDDLRKRLRFSGVMTSDIRNTLKQGAALALANALDALLVASEAQVAPLFERHPALKPLLLAEDFLADMETSVAYGEPQAPVDAKVIAQALGRISFDYAGGKLRFRGVMTPEMRDGLKAIAGVSSAFKAAADDLFNTGRAMITAFFASQPAFTSADRDAYIAAGDSLSRRRQVLLAALLPELKAARIRQQTLQTAAAATGGDFAITATLLDDAAVLHAADDPSRPAVEDLIFSAKPGLSAEFYFADTVTGPARESREFEASLDYRPGRAAGLPENTDSPGAAISAIWKGYIDPSEDGFYKLKVVTEPGATVRLWIDGADAAMTEDSGTWTNSKPIEITAGHLHSLKLEVAKLRQRMTLSLASNTGMGWQTVPAQLLYSDKAVSRMRATYLRALKAATLAAALRLTPAELRHFATDDDYQIAGKGWLNALATSGTTASSTVVPMRTALDGLLEFVAAKQALRVRDDAFVDALRNPVAATAGADAALFTLTGWQPAALDALLIHFGKVAADGSADRAALGSFAVFCRVREAFGWLDKLGVPAAALIAAATNEPEEAPVTGMLAALRARHAPEDWATVIGPINDTLRGLSRTALVAYILHKLRNDPARSTIDTPDKLFGYFLMDVQMEPCMQTSRIRHALSSVQLFIERALMNLEKGVSSSLINAKQWDWQKRYRVWEANRKVFLWPENWLEPELRDDQSVFFKETMSELLQSDITQDRAAAALSAYLGKLAEVAKLEPCGIHYVEGEPGTIDDVIHVVARTAGSGGAYYHRRRTAGGWTPWDPIKLSIDGDPVIPVVWKSRLFLFWLKMIRTAPTAPPPTPPTGVSLAGVQATQVMSATPPMETVQALLCWSEYYEGKWLPARISDSNKPFSFAVSGKYRLDGDRVFDRNRLEFMVRETDDGALWLAVRDTGYVSLKSSRPNRMSIIVYNTHSGPEQAPADLKISSPSVSRRRMFQAKDKSKPLSAIYGSDGGAKIVQIVTNKTSATWRLMEPQHAVSDPWTTPFLYGDARHVFYVTPSSWTYQAHPGVYGPLFPTWPGAVTIPPIPPIIVQKPPAFTIPDLIGPIVAQPPISFFDPGPVAHLVSEDAYINKGIAALGAVKFGTSLIGPAGFMK